MSSHMPKKDSLDSGTWLPRPIKETERRLLLPLLGGVEDGRPVLAKDKSEFMSMIPSGSTARCCSSSLTANARFPLT